MSDGPKLKANCHRNGQDDGVTTLSPVRDRFPDFAAFIADEAAPDAIERLRRAESIGRPLGGDDFMRALEAQTGRPLKPSKRGRKPFAKADPDQPELNALSP